MTVWRPPAEDRTLSPYTGWTRAHWAALADHLLLSLRPYFSATRSRILLPGPTSANGVDSDALEGFARSMMLFAFRIAGEGGSDPHGFTSWYRAGLVAGTDPANPERWPSAADVGQARVEAASIALCLQLTRPWLWDTLGHGERQHIIDWLAGAPGGQYADNNWWWFRITVETFLASVGGPHDPARVAADLARLESFYRTDGWYADGPLRAYDYYCGWAMHLYPLLWARSQGAAPFGAEALTPVFRGRLDRFLDDYITLIGADGMPVIEGRSLVYRFAAAAPLWMGAITGATHLGPGTLRRAASGILRAYVDRGGVDGDGLLTLGLFGPWPAMAQSYSGSGSPYWAAKGMLGLLLPADHAVWTAVEEPLPVETADVRRVVRAAGWLVSGTAADGIVRVYNHGTDHAAEGDRTGDSPLYTRFGYSSATMPPLVGATIDSPLDNTVGEVDAEGRITHRTGFTRGIIGDDGACAFASSTADAHWVDSGDITGPDHGSGRPGVVAEAGPLQTASLVRGPWEVRVARRAGGDATHRDGGRARLRFCGWPVACAADEDARVHTSASDVTIASAGLHVGLQALIGSARPHVETGTGVSPLGERVLAPQLDFDDTPVGEMRVVASYLGRPSPGPAPAARVVPATDGSVVEVTWPDGPISTIML